MNQELNFRRVMLIGIIVVLVSVAGYFGLTQISKKSPKQSKVSITEVAQEQIPNTIKEAAEKLIISKTGKDGN